MIALHFASVNLILPEKATLSSDIFELAQDIFSSTNANKE